MNLLRIDWMYHEVEKLGVFAKSTSKLEQNWCAVAKGLEDLNIHKPLEDIKRIWNLFGDSFPKTVKKRLKQQNFLRLVRSPVKIFNNWKNAASVLKVAGSEAQRKNIVTLVRQALMRGCLLFSRLSPSKKFEILSRVGDESLEKFLDEDRHFQASCKIPGQLDWLVSSFSFRKLVYFLLYSSYAQLKKHFTHLQEALNFTFDVLFDLVEGRAGYKSSKHTNFIVGSSMTADGDKMLLDPESLLVQEELSRNDTALESLSFNTFQALSLPIQPARAQDGTQLSLSQLSMVDQIRRGVQSLKEMLEETPGSDISPVIRAFKNASMQMHGDPSGTPRPEVAAFLINPPTNFEKLKEQAQCREFSQQGSQVDARKSDKKRAEPKRFGSHIKRTAELMSTFSEKSPGHFDDPV